MRAASLLLALLLAGWPLPEALAGQAARVAEAPGLAAPDLQRFLARVERFQAGFTQTVLDARGRQVEESTGTVAMERPGRFRWDYQQPFTRTIVADGTRIWLYEADLAQVTVRRLQAGLGDTPAALLTGRDDVLERFVVQRRFSEGGLAWTVLVPRQGDGDFSALQLGFRGESLVELRLADRLGQQTRIAFTGIRVNPAIPEGTFRFVTPPGSDVIDDSGL